MKQKFKTFLRQTLTNIGLLDDLTTQEVFHQFILDQKHKTLVDRIKEIRNNSLYEPDYNKPKVFTDIIISYNSTPKAIIPDYEPINSNVRTSCERPDDFGGDVGEWFKSLSIDHLASQKDKEEKEAEFQKVMQERYENVNKFYNKLLKVN